MNMIFSADRNWGIGYKNQLLFRVSADMKRFRKMTTGKAVIMGRKTLDSLPGGRPLPNRTNIVLSRDPDFTAEGVIVCRDLDELFGETGNYPEGDVFVIGGEQVYRLLAPYCRKAYITRWNAEAKADTFMEDLSKNPQWRLSEVSGPMEEDGLEFVFELYVRV